MEDLKKETIDLILKEDTGNFITPKRKLALIKFIETGIKPKIPESTSETNTSQEDYFKKKGKSIKEEPTFRNFYEISAQLKRANHIISNLRELNLFVDKTQDKKDETHRRELIKLKKKIN